MTRKKRPVKKKKPKIKYHEPPMKYNPALHGYEVDTDKLSQEED